MTVITRRCLINLLVLTVLTKISIFYCQNQELAHCFIKFMRIHLSIKDHDFPKIIYPLIKLFVTNHLRIDSMLNSMRHLNFKEPVLY